MLAASAAKAGITCKVIDVFADSDTQTLAGQAATAPFSGYGFQAEALLAAADRLDPQARCGVVYGSGFEADADVLSELCRQRPLLGNSPQTINLVKQPESLAGLLQTLNIPHPAIRLDPPQTGDWLEKQNGACGGSHISRLDSSVIHRDTGVYYQQFVTGRSLSVTCLSDARDALIIGFCEQWHAGLIEHPFTYGGAVSLDPVSLAAPLVEEIRVAARVLARHTGLRGVWGMDLIAGERNWWLLEINPRPCATLELHEGADSLLPMHIAAVHGQLPVERRDSETQRGHAIVYAEEDLAVPARDWPHWISDRPRPGTVIRGGEPVCTVHAQGQTPDAVREKLKQRYAGVIADLAGWQAILR